MKLGQAIQLTTLFCIASLLLVAGTRPHAQSKGRYITGVDEKIKVIEARQPDKKQLQTAERALSRTAAGDVALLNAMRLVARPDPRLVDDPYLQGRLALPELGSLAGDADHQPDSWVLLRLLALLRSGYPGEPALAKECEAWLASGMPGRNQPWADVSLELMTLHALSRRKEPLLQPVRELAIERAKAIVERRTWTHVAPKMPEVATVVGQFHFLLAHRTAVSAGWLEEADAAIPLEILKQIEDGLKSHGKKPSLWFEIAADKDSDVYRALMFTIGTTGLLAQTPVFKRSERSRAEKALRTLGTHLPAKPEQRHGWRCYKGDAAALYFMGGSALNTPVHKAITAAPAEFALSPGRHTFALPRPHNNHISVGLGWVLCPGPKIPGMGRNVLSIEERDQLSVICMAMLGAVGGFTAEHRPVPAPDVFAGQMAGLDTLDLNDYYGYMITTDKAIDSAADWLQKQLQNDRRFFGNYRDMLGGQGLAIQALLEAGVPRDHRQIKRAWPDFISMIKRDLPNAARQDRSGAVAWGRYNYGMSIALMVFQSYYKQEIRESGMLTATTYEAYHKARQKVWEKIDPDERNLIAEISWRLCNADGYGWSYLLPEMRTPIPTPSTIEPGKKAGNPVTGEKTEDLSEDELNERLRRTREGKFPPRAEVDGLRYRHADNSNSQYSILGIKAGMMLGAPMDFTVLAWEAERLFEASLATEVIDRLVEPTLKLTQDPQPRNRDDGYVEQNYDEVYRKRAALEPLQVRGWSYFAAGLSTWGRTDNKPIGEDKDGNPVYRWPYSVAMTAAGVSSLSIIRDALLMAPVYDPETISKIDEYLEGGLFALGRIYPYHREFFEINVNMTDGWVGGAEGRGMMYDMYSCERAGILTGNVFFGNTDWYRDGADLLIKEQARDGSWTSIREHLCNTSWAILFLKRSVPYLASRPPASPEHEPPTAKRPVTGK